MKPSQVFCLLILVLLTRESTKALKLAKNGCEEKCGEVGIPFPFGIGARCAMDERYIVDCNTSTPYLAAFNNMEVLNISLEQQTITVNVSIIVDCQNRILNSSQILVNYGTIVTGCSATCHNDTFSDINNCFGVGCCQATVPHYLEQFTLNLTGLEGHGEDGSCGSAFLVDKDSFMNGSFSRQSIATDHYSVPISLFWPLTLPYERDMKTFERSECSNLPFHLEDGSLEGYIKCQCNITHEGNPYLPNGCKKTEKCKSCERDGGVCGSRLGFYDDATSQSRVIMACELSYSHKTSLGVVLGISISMGVLLLMAFIYALYKIVTKTIAKRQKEKFFKRNGGLLLKQQETTDTSLIDKTILFTSRELETATDHFSESRILGRGGQGTVYKGMLTDGRIVAIKKSKVVDESQIEQFINEVVILSQVNHRNVVKLLGCCLETEVPLLVSEFISNGTLYDLIQDKTGEFPISLNKRIQIAIEVAGALSYLHSATSIPIYHRDIKTTNILLDEKYRAKVSDFGTSRFVSIDQTHLTTKVKGTFGYFDPEYFLSSQFTEKSDVYSFGVVLLELLTREKPILTCLGEHRSLAAHFMLAMEEGRVMSIFDTMIVNEESKGVLLDIANLAMLCLNFNGKNRPTMKEVSLELEGMRMPHVPTIVQTSSGDTKYNEGIPLLTYDESTSTTLSFEKTFTE